MECKYSFWKQIVRFTTARTRFRRTNTATQLSKVNFVSTLHYLVKSLLQSSTQLSKNRKKPPNPLVYITKILDRKNPRQHSAEAEEAGKKELFLEQKEPADGNLISSAFVITVKDVETDSSIFKARFVSHGNRKKGKNGLLHSSKTVRSSSVRLLSALPAIMKFNFWSEYISQA